MRQWPWLVVILFFPLLTGMGGLGGSPNGSIPETQENYRATVTDHQGVRTELSQFSMEGKTLVQGLRGSGRLTVPFSRITGIAFGEETGDQIAVAIHLRSGETVPLVLGRRALFYGSTGFGTFEIRARDLRQIEFH